MMTVAVTGASGFIGRHVVPLLLKRGHHVRVLDRRSDPSRFAPGVETITGDVTDAAAVARFVFGAEIVSILLPLLTRNLSVPGIVSARKP